MPGCWDSSGWHGCLDWLCPANASATSVSRVAKLQARHLAQLCACRSVCRLAGTDPTDPARSTADANRKAALAPNKSRSRLAMYCIALKCVEADSALLTMVRKVHAQEWRQQFAETRIVSLIAKAVDVQTLSLQLTLCRPLPSLSYQLPCRDSTSAAVQCSTRGARLSRGKVKTHNRQFTGLCKSVHPWGRVSEIQSIKESANSNCYRTDQRKQSPPKMYTCAMYQA